MNSELHRFGLERNRLPDVRQWNKLMDLMTAIVTNPDLNIGDRNSEFVPRQPVGNKAAAAVDESGTPPFWVERHVDQVGDPYVTVTEGVVEDHVNQTGDAILYYDPGVTGEGGKPNRYILGNDSAIYVLYLVRPSGAIGLPDEMPAGWPDEIKALQTPCTIVVGGLSMASSHYTPGPVGYDSDGAPGYYYVKLAEMTGNTVVPYAMGSNIEHYRELPRFVTRGGLEIFSHYDMGNGQYRYYGPTGIDRIRVTMGVNDWEIHWDGEANLDLTIKFVELYTPPFPEEYDEINTQFDLPAIVGTTGTGSTEPFAKDGEHEHPGAIVSGQTDPHYEDTNNTATGHVHGINQLNAPLLDVVIAWPEEGDGKHSHQVNIPAQTGIYGHIKIPKRPYIRPTETTPIILCWRDGLFLGEFGEGEQPEVPQGQPAVISKTITVFDPSSLPTYHNYTIPSNSSNIPTL